MYEFVFFSRNTRNTMFTVFSVDLSQLDVQNAFILFDLPQIITETSAHICI
jgi:hypothetical protein